MATPSATPAMSARIKRTSLPPATAAKLDGVVPVKPFKPRSSARVAPRPLERRSKWQLSATVGGVKPPGLSPLAVAAKAHEPSRIESKGPKRDSAQRFSCWRWNDKSLSREPVGAFNVFLRKPTAFAFFAALFAASLLLALLSGSVTCCGKRRQESKSTNEGNNE